MRRRERADENETWADPVVPAGTGVVTYYDRLAVLPTASAEQLQHAYRRAARDAHPDRHGHTSSARMVEINEAWQVLGNPSRRRTYDEMLVLTNSAFTSSVEVEDASDHGAPSSAVRARFRCRFGWKAVASIEAVVLAVVIGVQLFPASDEAAPTGNLSSGDCVVIDAARPPTSVRCTSRHDAVVESLIPFGRSCPDATVPYRSRMGRVCVVPVAEVDSPSS